MKRNEYDPRNRERIEPPKQVIPRTAHDVLPGDSFTKEPERTEYDEQAEKFCKDFGFEVKAAFKGDRCPPWDDEKHIHGDRYRVTIKRTGPDRVFHKGEPGARSLSLDFWNSLHDKETGERPSAYDILACISSDATLPTDPDELISEIGPMTVKQALASVEFTKRLSAFFTEAEIDALGEIR